MQRSTLERARTGLVKKSGQSAFLYLCWCAYKVRAVLGSRMFDGCSDPMHVIVVGTSNSALRRILFTTYEAAGGALSSVERLSVMS